MSSNRPPIELPPTIITPDPLPTAPVKAPPAVFQPWNEKILHPDAFGDLPIKYFDDRYTYTVIVALLDSIHEMQDAYELARSGVAKSADTSLTQAGFKFDLESLELTGLYANQEVLHALISTTETEIPLAYSQARTFFEGRNPHDFDGVKAFDYMFLKLYGRGVANQVYHAWIASYQAQYKAVLLEAQLAYLKQHEVELNKAIEALEKSPKAYSAPAIQTSTTPMVLGAGRIIPAIPNAGVSLTAAIETAVTRMLGVTAASVGGAVAVFAGMVYSPKLGDGSRFPTTVPLATLYPASTDLRALAAANGELNLPVRLGISTGDEQISFYVAATGAVPGNVRVRQATYDPATGTYSFTTHDTPPRTLIWTPIHQPGDSSTNSPPSDTLPPNYTGPVVKPVDPYIEVLPGLEEGGFDDYIIVFPADSGLDPIYVMFNDRRDEPGVATGNGQDVSGAWLPQAAGIQGAPFPASIGNKLSGRTFSSFRMFRKTFWRAALEDELLASQFTEAQKTRLKKGLSPRVPIQDRVGGRKVYELHHVTYISKNGEVYNLDNLRIMTPKSHIEYHFINKDRINDQ